MKNPKQYKLVQVKTELLKVNPKNARTHSEKQVAQIAKSIDTYGFTNPLLIDGERMIVAGEGRYRAARMLELAKVPCFVLAGLSPVEKQAYAIADNKIALNSGWDTDLLQIELGELSKVTDLELTGFTEEEFKSMFRDPDPPASKSAGTKLSFNKVVTCPKCKHEFEA